MSNYKDFFPILKKIIRNEEKFFDYTDVQFHNEFHQTAKEWPFLYIWFNEEIKSLSATFRPPHSLSIIVTNKGWSTKGHTLQFEETPLGMIGTNQDILLTVFKNQIIINPETKYVSERFLKRLKEIDSCFFIAH